MKIDVSTVNRRPILIALAIIVGTILTLWLAVQALVNTDALREKAIAAIEQSTGYKMEIGSVSLSVFPLPSVTFEKVAILNAEESNESYFFTANAIKMRLDMAALIKGVTVVRAVDISQLQLNLELAESGKGNWLPAYALLDGVSAQSVRQITLHGGAVHFINLAQNEEKDVKDIRGMIRLDAQGVPNGNFAFTAFDQAGELKLASSGGQVSSANDFSFKTEAELRFGAEFVKFAGDVSRASGKRMVLNGQLLAEAQSTRLWLERMSNAKAKEGAFSIFPESLPLRLDMTMNTSPVKGEIRLKNLTLGESAGAAAIVWLEAGEGINAKGSFNVATLNADQLLGEKNGNLNAFFSLFLPPDVEGEFNVGIKRLIYKGAPLTNAAVTARLTQGEMNINQFTGAMGGKSRGFLFGIMKRDARGKINFDGSAEILGEDAASFLQDSGFDKVNLIPQAHSKFRARSNIFLSDDRGTFSEIRFQGGNFYMVGGVNMNAGGKHDIEVTMRLRNVRMEPLAAFFAPITAKAATTDAQLLDRHLPWLSQLDKKIYLNLLFDDFTLGDRQGARSQFILSMAKDKVDFEQIDVNFTESKLQGTASFEQSGEVPHLVANLTLSDYDLNSLLGPALVKHPVPRGNRSEVWPLELFETSFLRGYDSEMKIRIDRAKHESFTLENVNLAATSTNGEWKIDDLSADVFGGKLAAKISLDMTSVPSFSSAFYLSNMRVEELLNSFAGFQGLRGTANLTADISSSGVSAGDMIRNMSGTMAFSGRDIVLRGFDLASLVQTVPSVRSVADVVNTVRIATLKGASSFSLVEGGFYFAQGSLGTQGVTFRSRHAIGTLSGTIDLLHWLMDASIQFKLISIVNEEFPIVSVIFNDTLDSPLIDLDTRSLEAWVARQKLLQ